MEAVPADTWTILAQPSAALLPQLAGVAALLVGRVWRPALLGAVGACSLAGLARYARDSWRRRRHCAELEALSATLASKRADLEKLCILEGFLRRLAASPTHLVEGFALHGCLLTRQLVAPAARDAGDVQLLALFPWDPSGQLVEDRVRAVLQTVASDGVCFSLEGSLHREVLQRDRALPLVRLRVPGRFLGRHAALLVDVAACSLPPHGIRWLTYRPSLGSPFRLVALQPEGLFAQKLSGLFEGNTKDELGRNQQGRWQPQDVHDLYLLMRCGQLDTEKLPAAIGVAFCCYGQDSGLVERLLSKEFGSSTGSQRQWRRYRQSTSAPDEVPLHLHEVVGALADFLRPVLQPAGHDSSGPAAQEGGAKAFGSRSLQPIQQLDSAAMVLQLPGSADVLRSNCSVHVSEDLSSHADLVQPGNTVRFAGRKEEFEVAKVRPPRPREGASPVKCLLILRTPPHFTARSCSAELVCRRVKSREGLAENADVDSSLSGGAVVAEAAHRVGLRRALGMRELQPSAEERRILEEAGATADKRLARRLDVMRPLAPLCYVTSSRRKFEEAQRCLAEWQSMLTMADDVKPPLTERLPVEELVKAMARYSFNVLEIACFLDIAYLELDGEDGPIFALGMTEEAFAARHRGRRGRLRSFLGFCEDGCRVEVFEGTLEGQVVDPRGSGPLHNTWDRVWLPDDFPGTLAELETSAFVVSARHLPFLELAQTLRGRDYSQIFEIHVTVQAPEGQADPMQTFRDACLGLKSSFGAVKPVLIQNASGEAARQMMTASHHVGTLPEVHVLAFRLSQALVQQGYRVERTKIEANMSNSGVPISDEEAARLSPENYFEFHVKLSLPPGFDEDNLRAVTASNDARLSRSALRVTGQGVQKRFVTQRLYGIGRDSALKRFERCCSELSASGFAIESRIREYAVYDSNVRLDRGWIDAPGKLAQPVVAEELQPAARLPRTSTATEAQQAEPAAAGVPPEAPALDRDTSAWEQGWRAQDSECGTGPSSPSQGAAGPSSARW